MKRKSSTVLLLSLLIGSMTVAHAHPPSYRIVPVRFPVPDNFQPTAINRKHQIAVSMDSEQQNHLWLGSNGQYRELATCNMAGGTLLGPPGATRRSAWKLVERHRGLPDQ
jgi:hypothetical protein